MTGQYPPNGFANLVAAEAKLAELDPDKYMRRLRNTVEWFYTEYHKRQENIRKAACEVFQMEEEE